MKVGLISDVHGNIDALNVVLKEMKGLGIKTLICAGDFVGYYYQAAEALEALKSFEMYAVRGNHEDMLAESLNNSVVRKRYKRKYGSGIDTAIESLSDSQLTYLMNLPKTLTLKILGKRILICHGSPWDTNQYIYPNSPSELLDRCYAYEFDYLILGHTHYPMVDERSTRRIVNAGSVGQARGASKGKAQWGMIDLKDNEILLRENFYDKEKLLENVKRTDPENGYLLSILV